MGRNPLIGMVLGVVAIGLTVFSMATRTETTSPGYAMLDYGVIVLGAAGFVGSLVVYLKQKNSS